MSTIYNRYGMPNAGYNQPAETNPIDAGVQSGRTGMNRQPVRPIAPPAPTSPVGRDGSVNLGMVPQMGAPMPMAPSGVGDLLGGALSAPHSAPYPTGQGAAPPGVTAPPEALGLISQLQGTLPPTSQSLDPIIAALKAKGYNAQRATHAGNLPSDDKLTVNGGMYDLIGNVGGPDAKWGMNYVAPNGSGGNSALASALMAPSTGTQMTQGILQSLAAKNALRF